MPGGVDERIVIIDIDEKSLASEGRWPWPRDRVARLVDILFDKYEIGLLGMDVVWAEPDESSGLKTLEGLASSELSDNEEFLSVLKRIRPRLERDRIFADSIKTRPIVLGYYFDTEASADAANTSGELPAPLFTDTDFRRQNVTVPEASGYGGNLSSFQMAAMDAGHFNPDPDIDGVVRKIPMLIKYEKNYYGSLSLAIIKQLLNNTDITPGFVEGSHLLSNYNGMEWLQLGQYRIPVDELGRSLVPYRGPKHSFKYVSASDILNEKANLENLKGTIALLGTSAPGLLDLRATPMQSNYPGVEIHANLIAGFIDQTIKHKPAWSVGAEFILILVIGLSMAILLPVMGPFVATLFSASLAAISLLINFYFWSQLHIAMPVASSLLLIFLLYVANMSYGFFVESRGKRQLAGLFGQYIPPELVSEMNVNASGFSLEGDSRHMTVFFSDVRDFTSISEALEPGELQRLMNELLTPVTRTIHQHRGTIDKYMGDAVMAFWGAPLNDTKHAQNAVHAALAIVKLLREIQPRFKENGWPELRLGIGINSGTMRVGDMGSEFRRAYTVMGDAVNLGSRLEGLTKQYGVDIIVSETTRKEVPDIFFRELDMVRVKGKDRPVTIYQPLCKQMDISKALKSEINLYKQALKYYREKNWDLAELQFLNLQKSSPDDMLYKIYAKRIQFFRKNPPPDKWDGVFTYKTK